MGMTESKEPIWKPKDECASYWDMRAQSRLRDLEPDRSVEAPPTVIQEENHPISKADAARQDKELREWKQGANARKKIRVPDERGKHYSDYASAIHELSSAANRAGVDVSKCSGVASQCGRTEKSIAAIQSKLEDDFQLEKDIAHRKRNEKIERRKAQMNRGILARLFGSRKTCSTGQG